MSFYAINPRNNEQLKGEFQNATDEQINEAVAQAVSAFEMYRKKDKDSIAGFLNQIGDEILALGDGLIQRCSAESGLPEARLIGERGRTVNQIKLFASVVKEGSWVDARIDTAQPDRVPIPKPDIRYMLIPLGPVAVFGASNFPLAFSVAGGDTASALAAGCPVIVKGHPAHPGTSELVAKAIQTATEKTGMPTGVFALLQGNTIEVGGTLVKHTNIKAVGFTGSFGGGKALFDLANSRPEPIPVFAEMGSTNPVFFLPGALKENAEGLAQGLAGSIALGVGQFCTNPGLNFVQKSSETQVFEDALAKAIGKTASGTMLTPGIKTAYSKGLETLGNVSGVGTLAKGLDTSGDNEARAVVFKTSAEVFAANHILAEENFGPSSVLVEANTKDGILEAARSLEGHLTATVHGTPADLEEYKDLFDILEQKVGRVIVNGYPTGVEVCHSMVHGGPYPATTAPQSTSVGTNAIKRFVRPVSFQNYPDSLLPNALKNDNLQGIWRLIDGEFTK